MGMVKKYHNLKVLSFKDGLKNTYGVFEGNILISTIRGLTKEEAEKQLIYHSKLKTYKFTRPKDKK